MRGQEHYTGALLARLETDAAMVHANTGPALGMRVQHVVTLLCGLVLAGVTSWSLGLVALVALPPTAAVGALYVNLSAGAQRPPPCSLPAPLSTPAVCRPSALHATACRAQQGPSGSETLQHALSPR